MTCGTSTLVEVILKMTPYKKKKTTLAISLTSLTISFQINEGKFIWEKECSDN